MALFDRNGGFLFPECWLFKNGMGGFFDPDYASSDIGREYMFAFVHII